MIASENSLRLAIRNVAYWGDTDVLPFPLENHWFHDDEEEVLDLLGSVDNGFDTWITAYPILYVQGLSNVGYVGYRAAMQIDPIWNVYLLALCIEIAGELERVRLPVSDDRVFSYRFSPDHDTYTLFDREIGWHAFQRSALERSLRSEVVLNTDISDFYPRIYHHRLRHALRAATVNHEAVTRIMTILKGLNSAGVSYGLPIGGNAARILAETLLQRTDRLLISKGVDFCRFVDDYIIIADSEEAARRDLVVLSRALLDNEGLSLSRGKTRIMTAEEYQRISPAIPPEDAESESEDVARHFLKIRLKYDPYSPTADEDYKELADELRRFDIVGMLAREFQKSRIDEALTKQIAKSLKYLDEDVRDDAVESLIENLDVLFPVFPTIAIVLKGILSDLGEDTRRKLFDELRSHVESQSHMFQVDANLAFAVRLLAYDSSETSDSTLAAVHDRSSSILIRRDVILAMAARRADYWVSDRLRQWAGLTAWEKRSLLAASFALKEEGRYWRSGRRKELGPVEEKMLSWLSAKNDGVEWSIPV